MLKDAMLFYFGRWDVFTLSNGATVFTVRSLPLAILVARLGKGLDYAPEGRGWSDQASLDASDPWYGRRDP